MNPVDRIFVAGHRGLVGSALARQLRARGFSIHANIAIQSSVIRAAHTHGIKRLLFLGSSCIYPRDAPQPMVETSLLTGPLEPTNRAYAVAKIAGIEMCRSYNRQHGTKYLCVMPTNLYGPNDNYHLQDSHVIPALLRKFHEARQRGEPQVIVWGSGSPRREFLHCDDMASACVHLMTLPDEAYDRLLGAEPPLVNIGTGDDVTIRELAQLVGEVVGYAGDTVFDTSKPDGAPRKLLDVGTLHACGWRASIGLREGLAATYADFLSLAAEGQAGA